MILEAATNMRHLQEINVVAIPSSTTSMEHYRLQQYFLYWPKEGRIPDDMWGNIEQEYDFCMDFSAHTTQEFTSEFEIFRYESTLDPYINVPCIEEETSSSLCDNESSIIEQIKTLVESGRVSEARNILSGITLGISPALDNWHKILAKPQVKCEDTATGGNLKDDSQWLQQHAMQYKGQWVALKQGILLGSHSSRLKLHQELKQRQMLAGALFFRVD